MFHLAGNMIRGRVHSSGALFRVFLLSKAREAALYVPL
jgi:hypothetical protein